MHKVEAITSYIAYGVNSRSTGISIVHCAHCDSILMTVKPSSFDTV